MTENETNFINKNSKTLVIGAIIAACLIIYGQTLWFDFINIDDRAYIYENRALLSGFNWSSIKWAFTEFYSAKWHPLTWLSHFLDYALFGLNAGGHHATNVLFHTINSILTFAVFRKMTNDFWKSAIVAMLFAIHPAHVESVAWVAERKDVLSTFFWLLTMLFYFKYAETRKGERENGRRGEREMGRTGEEARLTDSKSDKNLENIANPKEKIATQTNEKSSSPHLPFSLSPFLPISLSLLFTLGLMSKPMLVTLPFVLLLCDFWALERLKKLSDLKPLIIEKLPLFVLTIISSVITFLAQKSVGAAVSLESLTLGERLVNVILSYAKYILMMFYPVNLGFWYPFEPNPNPLAVVGAIALLLGISALCWRERNRRKYLLMGWLWFLGTLVPVIGLVQVGLQSLADRYTYVPYFGLFIMLVWGAGDLFAHFKLDRKLVAAVCAIALTIFGALAFIQTSHWKSSETLYTHTLSFTKNNYFLLTNLCLHHFTKSAPDIAEARCSELLAQTPPSADAHYVLGVLRRQTGKYDQAAQNFQAAIQMRPDWGILYTGLADTFARQGKPDEAEKNLQKAFTINDGSLNNETLARTANNVGTSYLINKQNDKAIQYFTKALELKPDLKEAQDNLKKAKGEQ